MTISIDVYSFSIQILVRYDDSSLQMKDFYPASGIYHFERPSRPQVAATFEIVPSSIHQFTKVHKILILMISSAAAVALGQRFVGFQCDLIFFLFCRAYYWSSYSISSLVVEGMFFIESFETGKAQASKLASNFPSGMRWTPTLAYASGLDDISWYSFF